MSSFSPNSGFGGSSGDLNNRLTISRTWNGKELPNPLCYYLEVSFCTSTSEMILYVDAPFHGDPAPPPLLAVGGERPPIFPADDIRGDKIISHRSQRYPGLWDYEVVELFIGPGIPPDMDGIEVENLPYLEINIGPHGHYYISNFPSQGNWANKYDEFELERPLVIEIDRAAGRWRAKMCLSSFIIPEPYCADDLSTCWRMNAFAIYGLKSNNTRTYLAHSVVPGDKPNFHQLKSFVPVVLLEESMTYDFDESNTLVDLSVNTSISALASTNKVKRYGSPSETVQHRRSSMHGIIFSPSTVNADNSRRLIEELGGTRNGPVSLVDVMNILRAKYVLPEIPQQFKIQAHPDETVVLYGIVWKRKVGLANRFQMLSKIKLMAFQRSY
jgi:hypothetical protein